MGVPAFFRWLQRKYPSIVVNAVEERNRELDGTEIPVDCTKPNPNHQEFDNLYLDMNGIIHPCTHPENRPAPTTEEEMFVLIFEYIDRLFSIVRPRRVLYMAIDGVAPRAKMNQQRSRRFRAAKEAIEKEEEISKIRGQLEDEGIPLPPIKKAEDKFDTNCITPGTPFMDRLAVALRYYVHNRITLDPAWADIQVILSDSNCPGEGEHKIMDFIRRQRASPSHDPNTVHCLCGADADLIMLGLATHEANFNILREEFVPNQPRPCELCHQYGHELQACRGLATDEAPEHQAKPLDRDVNFIFIRLPVLREYLEIELEMPNLPFDFDLERAIDDWVFMCFFVGNDFLPHLPSLEIREGAIDRLIRLYKDMVYKTKGWLTDAGEVHLDHVQIIMNGLGTEEDHIFRQRQEREKRFKENQRSRPAKKIMPQQGSIVAPLSKPPEYLSAHEFIEARKKERVEPVEKETPQDLLDSVTVPEGKTDIQKTSPRSSGKRSAAESTESDPSIDEPAPKILKTSDDDETVDEEAPVFETDAIMEESDSDAESLDEVRLHEPGWKERYYAMKFGQEDVSVEFRHEVAQDYVEGLCWVLKYYYQGCASWDWYYPHHYAPFASDFDDIANFVPDFSKPTKPFNPLEQLMAVFPAASKSHIPEAWRALMTDEKSPLLEFYPPDFEIDLNGKKFAWQGVALLPFVDQKKLLEELAKVYPDLTDEEKRRNIRGFDRIFIKSSHPLYTTLHDAYTTAKETEGDIPKDADGCIIPSWIQYDPSLCKGMAGEIAYDKDAVEPGNVYTSILRNDEKYGDVDPNLCLMGAYRGFQIAEGFLFSAARLDGIKEIEKTLKPEGCNDGQYRPNVGFTRDRQYATLNQAGHRMVNRGHHVSRKQMAYRGIPSSQPRLHTAYKGHHSSTYTRNPSQNIYGLSQNQSSSYHGYFWQRGPLSLPLLPPMLPLGLPIPPSFYPHMMNYSFPPSSSYSSMAMGPMTSSQPPPLSSMAMGPIASTPQPPSYSAIAMGPAGSSPQPPLPLSAMAMGPASSTPQPPPLGPFPYYPPEQRNVPYRARRGYPGQKMVNRGTRNSSRGTPGFFNRGKRT